MTKLFLFISILVISFLLSFYQYFYKIKNVKNRVNYILFILRFIVFVSLGLLLLNLDITTKKTNLARPNLYVLIDNSESIEFLNQNNTVKEVYEKINESKLTSKFEVEYYSFGKQIKVLDSLNFINNETNIYNSLLEINGLSLSNNDAIILITDGIQTIGVDYQFLKSKASVYPIVVGDTASFTDLSIKQINANK